MSDSNVTCSYCSKKHCRDGNAGEGQRRGRGRRTRSRGQGAGGRVQIEGALSALKRKSEALTVAIGVQQGLLDAGLKELKGLLQSRYEVKQKIIAERVGVEVLKAFLHSLGSWLTADLATGDLAHWGGKE